MLVRDAYRAELVRIDSNATLFDVAEGMLASGAETLCVFEEDRLLGVIGLRDLFTAPIPAHYGNAMLRRASETQFLDVWKTMRARDLMNENILLVQEDTPLLRALELMVNSGKHPLVVKCEERVMGTLSRMDIVRALAVQGRESV